MDLDALLQTVMDSKISGLTQNITTPDTPTTPKREAYTGRSAFLSRMRTDAVTSRQGAQNMEDAASMMTTAQSGATAIKHMLSEMRKIAVDVHSNAHDLTPDEFASYTARLQEYARNMVMTAETTDFNGFKLLNGTAGEGKDGVVQLQAGNSSRDAVLVNMVDGSASGGQVIDGDKMNLKNMEALMNITDSASAEQVIALIDSVFERTASIESRYSNDIKSLTNLKVLLESQADIFDTVQAYHKDSNTDSKPQSYLDMLMAGGSANGSILSGRG